MFSASGHTSRCPAHLLVDGDSVYSREGTTQGGPLAMSMYALGMMPLLQRAAEAGAKRAWYADDSSGVKATLLLAERLRLLQVAFLCQ